MGAIRTWVRFARKHGVGRKGDQMRGEERRPDGGRERERGRMDRREGKKHERKDGKNGCGRQEMENDEGKETEEWCGRCRMGGPIACMRG